MNKTIIFGVLAVVVIAGIWYVVPRGDTPAPQGGADAAQETVQQQEAQTPAPQNTNTQPSDAVATPLGITLADVAKHATASDCWVVVGGKAYDVTAIIPKHPGGQEAILRACGKDATQTFMGQEKHGQVGAKEMLAQYYQGDVR